MKLYIGRNATWDMSVDLFWLSDAHPRTGAAQIVEIRETVQEVVIQRYVEEAIRLPRLFEGEALEQQRG